MCKHAGCGTEFKLSSPGFVRYTYERKEFNFEDTLRIYIYNKYICKPLWVKVYGENLDQRAIYFADNQNNFHCSQTSWG